VRQKHEDIDAAIEQFFDLAKLQFIVAIGGAGDDGTSEFMSPLLKFVEVGLPALAFRGLDGKSDLDFLLLRLRNTERQDDEKERNSGEKTRRNPHESIPGVAALRANESMSLQHPEGMMAPAVIRVNLPS
jgi:hypothetical protein